MKTELTACLSSLRLGEAQSYKNITILPLFMPGNGSPSYITLGEALSSGVLKVTEVSQSGSVPELKVINEADRPVLLLDGEELLGAKQNRVLNTSILLKEKSETIIPVSCTEQGRWAYASAAFAESDAIMAHQSRAIKMRSVTKSLESEHVHRSDQGEVWHAISNLHEKLGSQSPTHAMHDAFEARKEDLRKCLEVFQTVSGQNGLMVFINGEVAGMDLVSQNQAYVRLHAKLVKSYVLEGLVAPKETVLKPDHVVAKAKEFLQEAAACEVKEFDAVGYGRDCRFEGKQMAGTALIHEGRVIHTAFFQMDPVEKGGSMASLRQRRRHVVE